jgi:HPt (histidine-containing phosphotransfer) domain-containing protein
MSGQTPHTTNGAPAVDMPALLGRCLGNFKMAERVVSMFRAEGPADLAALSDAIETADFDAAVQAAHRLHGAAANVSAAGLRDVLKTAERLAREKNRNELLMILGRLHAEWDEFERFAQSLVSGPIAQNSREACHAGAGR